MTAEAVLAVDLGTTRVKAAAVALGGEVVAQGERAYGVLDDGEPGRAEQNADLWWRATAEAVGEVAERARGAAR
ncbi:MAG: hypothetical protein FJ028_07515, partial [Chloroflexi bacterium]|nr:hypothetical protein [Chloroflexota bacterium]